MHTETPGCQRLVPAASFVAPAGATRDLAFGTRVACSECDCIRGLDPRSPRPRLGFPRYVQGNAGFCESTPPVDFCNETRRTSTLRAPQSSPVSETCRTPHRAQAVSLTFARCPSSPLSGFDGPGAASHGNPAKKRMLLDHQRTGQVTSAGRQTPSEGPAQCGGDPPREPAKHSLCHRLAATEGWRDFRRARVLTVTSSKTLLGGRGAVRWQGKLAEAFVPVPTREGERFSECRGAFHHKLSARSVGIAPHELRTDLSVTLPVGIASGSASAFGTACRVSWP